jgi:hypothetical protein
MMGQSNHQYDSAYPAITDVLSEPFSNLVLVYGGRSGAVATAVAFQVGRTIRRVQRVSNPPTIVAGDTLDYGIIGDNGHENDVADYGKDIFRIETDRVHTIEEHGIAVNNSDVRVGVRSADGSDIIGLAEDDDRGGRGYSPSNFGEFGAVESELTTVEADELVPTTAVSENPDQGLIRVDSKTGGNNPLRFGFENHGNADATLDMFSVGARYKVNAVTQTDRVRQMLAGQVPNTRVVMYGGLTNTNPNLPSEWYDHAVSLAEDEVLPTYTS